MKQDAPAAEPIALSAFAPAFGPVLVVDPDVAVRRVVRLVLEGAGYHCVTCSSAQEATEMVPTLQPMLVLAEAQLQEPGGNLAKQLSAVSPQRPYVALMSAYPRPPRGDEDYFIAKPLAFDRLILILEGLSRDGER